MKALQQETYYVFRRKCLDESDVLVTDSRIRNIRREDTFQT